LGGAYDAPDYEDCTVERQKSLFIVGIPLYGPTGGVKCVAEGEFKRDKTFAIAQLWMEQIFAGQYQRIPLNLNPTSETSKDIHIIDAQPIFVEDEMTRHEETEAEIHKKRKHRRWHQR